MGRTIEESRARLDELIRELATVTQGAFWRTAILSIYDQQDEVIGRHITYLIPSPASLPQVRLVP